VRAKLLKPEQLLKEYRWSSWPESEHTIVSIRCGALGSVAKSFPSQSGA
jgi:hypothetical protein